MMHKLSRLGQIAEAVDTSSSSDISSLQSLTTSQKLMADLARVDSTPKIEQWRSSVYESILKEAADKLSLLAMIADNTLSSAVLKAQSKPLSLDKSPEEELVAVDVDRLRKVQAELGRVLKQGSMELSTDQTCQHLIDYVAAYQKAKVTDELLPKAASHKKDLERAKSDLEREKSKADEELRKVDEETLVLADTKIELTQLIAQRQKYSQKETIAFEMGYKQQYSIEIDNASNELDSITRELEYERQAHEQMVEFLTWQREELEKSIEEVMNRFEVDLETKSKMLDDLKQKKEDTHDKYEDLQTEYDVIERTVVEEKEENARKIEGLVQGMRKLRAARKLQKWWRKVRAARKAKKAKGK
eukprot:Partr_v1_DN25640_c0_g1_i2_m4854